MSHLLSILHIHFKACRHCVFHSCSLSAKLLNRKMWLRADKLACLLGAAAVGVFTVVARGEPSKPVVASTNTVPAFKHPATLGELLALPDADLEKVDVGLINILCAEGLPGSENLNVSKCLDSLDTWAQRVKAETDRHFHRFVEHPELFCHSLAYYRMQMMGDVLVNDLRMRYNPERAAESIKGLDTPEAVTKFFADSKDIFLFGLLDGDRYGTCASMPFLYVAIGRRLGYPVNLQATQEHFYVRCEDANGDHLNVEATAVSRFKTPPDEYYRDMIAATNRDDEISQAGWLRPLSNKEIVGHSLLSRIACLRSAGKNDEELKTWDIAAKYLPDTPRWRESINARKEEAANNRDTAGWNALWRQVEQAPVPIGAGFVYFRDQKIRLHNLMLSGAGLGVIQKAVDDFDNELEKYFKSTIESSGQPTLNLPQSGPTFAAHFRFSDSGKDIVVPEDLMPPSARGGLSQPVVDEIFTRNLDNENAILNFLWDEFEKATLRQHAKEKAKMDALAEYGPQPILIAQESIPPEYWNGLPQNLALRLQGENDPQEIIANIYAYRAEELSRQHRAQPIANAPQQSSWNAQPAPSPLDDYLERQRQMAEQARANAERLLHPNVPLAETCIRFVPAATIQGRPFLIAPGTPNFPTPQTAQQMPTPAILEKGNP